MPPRQRAACRQHKWPLNLHRLLRSDYFFRFFLVRLRTRPGVTGCMVGVGAEEPPSAYSCLRCLGLGLNPGCGLTARLIFLFGGMASFIVVKLCAFLSLGGRGKSLVQTGVQFFQDFPTNLGRGTAAREDLNSRLGMPNLRQSQPQAPGHFIDIHKKRREQNICYTILVRKQSISFLRRR